ncbi:MAG: AtpZ/AtpI family protein [Actinobacteria bacterium]|nr:AtpZ/AtpI family protein [Actinomycetota bacterium]
MPDNQKKKTKAKPNGGRGGNPLGWEWIASYLVGGVALGTISGLGLDYLLHTTPLFLIVGVFAGFAAGLYGIYKSL